MKSLKNQKGFSLIELLIVIGLLALIATIGYNTYYSPDVKVNAISTKLKSDLSIMAQAFTNCINDSGGQYPTKSNGTPLDATLVDFNTIKCPPPANYIIEGKNGFFTPRPETGFSNYQIAFISGSGGGYYIQTTLSGATSTEDYRYKGIIKTDNELPTAQIELSGTAPNQTLKYWLVKQ